MRFTIKHALRLLSATLAALASVGLLAAAELTHNVKPGDSLWALAKQHRVTVAQLQAANGLSGTVIRVGQKLVIPAPSAAVPNAALWRTARVTHVQKFGEWVIESVQREGGGLDNEGVRVRHRGAFVWASQPAIETAVDIYPGKGKPIAAESAGRAANLTAAGTPLVFVRRFTDTQRFVADTEIFTLEAGFKRLARLEGVPSEGASFKDVDGDGLAEAIVGSTAFMGFFSSRVEAYCPPMVLRLGARGFQAAPDLMRKLAPDEAELKRLAAGTREQLANAELPPDEPWQAILPPLCALAHGGNLESARRLFNEVVPWKGAERAAKWAEFERAFADKRR